MSGALKAGSVYVAVSASIGEFTKSLKDIVKGVEQTAARVKAAAAPLAEVGAIFAAGMAGAVVAASKSNARLAADLERLKSYLYTLAADVGDTFAPMVREITKAVGSIVGAFQRLSPEAKAALAHAVAFMAALGAGSAVVGKAASLIEGVAKVAGLVLVPAIQAASAAVVTLGGSMVAILPELALGAAALAGLVLLAGAFYKSWNTAGGTVRKVVGDVVAAMAGQLVGVVTLLVQSGQTVATMLSGILGTFTGMVSSMLDGIAAQVRAVAGLLAPLAGAAGLGGLAKQLDKLSQVTGSDIAAVGVSGAKATAGLALAPVKNTVSFAVGAGLNQLASAASALSYSIEGTGDMVRDAFKASGLESVFSELKGKFTGLFGGRAGKTREPRDFKKEADERYQRFSKNAEQLADYANATEARRAAIGERADEERLQASLEAMDEEKKREREMADLQAEAAEEQRAEFERGRRADEDAWQDFTRSVRDAARDAAEQVASAKAALVSRFAGAFGDLSSLISTFQEGMVAGGPEVAITAVLGDLLTQSAQFQHFVEVLNGIVAMVADTVGRLVEPFIPLLGAVSMLVRAGLDALAPAFSAIAAFIQPLVPPLVVLGELFQALAPIIGLVVSAMMLVQQPLNLFAGPVMKALFEVLKFVSKTILIVVRAVGGVWNGIVGAVQSVLRMLGDISIFGKKPLGFLNDWADGLDNAMVDTNALSASIRALSGLTWDQAQAAAAQTAETVRNYRNLAKANEELSNVPAAYKLALARFDAQQAQVGFTPVAGSSVPVSTMPGNAATTNGRGPRPGVPTGPAQPAVVVGSVTINATNPTEAMAAYERTLDAAAFRSRGSRAQSDRWATGEVP